MSPPKGKVKSKNDARVEYAELNPKLPDNEVVSLALQTIGSRAGRRPLSSPKEIDLLRPDCAVSNLRSASQTSQPAWLCRCGTGWGAFLSIAGRQRLERRNRFSTGFGLRL